MIGPFLNSAAIISGGILGVILKNIVPKRIEEGLPSTFSLVAMSLGVTMIIRVSNVPAVVIALLVGTVIGELFNLETGVQTAAGKLQRSVARVIPHTHSLDDATFARNFTSMMILFSVSALGIIGGLTEGLTGDYQLLIIKSLLDFPTALIFAISLGAAVAFIAVPQLLIQGAMFFLAEAIMPWMDEEAYGDFSALGGIIMLAIGLRIAGIKNYSVTNFLPGLLLVIPVSYLWRYWVS